MYAHEKESLERIASKLRSQFYQKIAFIYAFGSRTRGDHGTWSDFDVLIVVKEKKPEIEHDIMEAFVQEEMETGIVLSPLIKDQKSFDLERTYNSPFYQNIQREGVAL